MKLYHFTAAHMLDNIKHEGLTRGMIPVLKDDEATGDKRSDFRLLSGYQHLTINPDFGQSWERGSALPYRRNAVRITIAIPKSRQAGKLFPWISFCKAAKLNSARVLNSYGDPENWFVYRGKIPPGWFRSIDFRKATGAQKLYHTFLKRTGLAHF